MVTQGLEEKRDACTSAMLHQAAYGGHEETLTLLPSSSAPATNKGSNDLTPLMRASRRGHLDRVQKLLQSLGAEGLEERDVNAKTALHHAAAAGRAEIAAMLLTHGAQANSKDGKGVTPLMSASWRGHLGVVQQLLQVVGEQGLEEGDVYGWTALHHAADRGHVQIAAMLLTHGTQANRKDGEGVTSLMQASWRGHLGVVQKLFEVVGDSGLEQQDKDGWTALHFAIDGGHEEMVTFLVSNGAQANSKDNEGVTPLMNASSRGHLSVVQQLLQVVGSRA